MYLGAVGVIHKSDQSGLVVASSSVLRTIALSIITFVSTSVALPGLPANSLYFVPISEYRVRWIIVVAAFTPKLRGLLIAIVIRLLPVGQ